MTSWFGGWSWTDLLYLLIIKEKDQQELVASTMLTTFHTTVAVFNFDIYSSTRVSNMFCSMPDVLAEVIMQSGVNIQVMVWT